jgi:hypothetical protein
LQQALHDLEEFRTSLSLSRGGDFASAVLTPLVVVPTWHDAGGGVISVQRKGDGCAIFHSRKSVLKVQTEEFKHNLRSVASLVADKHNGRGPRSCAGDCMVHSIPNGREDTFKLARIRLGKVEKKFKVQLMSAKVCLVSSSDEFGVYESSHIHQIDVIWTDITEESLVVVEK